MRFGALELDTDNGTLRVRIDSDVGGNVEEAVERVIERARRAAHAVSADWRRLCQNTLRPLQRNRELRARHCRESADGRLRCHDAKQPQSILSWRSIGFHSSLRGASRCISARLWRPNPAIARLQRHDGSWLPRFLARQAPSATEFAVLLLALAPHLRPGFFDKLLMVHLPDGGDFPAFGGVRVAGHRGVLATGETVQFVLAGEDLETRLVVQRILSSEHWFARRRACCT